MQHRIAYDAIDSSPVIDLIRPVKDTKLLCRKLAWGNLPAG